MNKIKMWWFNFVMQYAARLCADTPFMFVEIIEIGNDSYLKDDAGALWALRKVPVMKITRVERDHGD